MRKIFCRQHKKLNKKGFTLVELLVSIAIMAVIAMLLAQFVASSTTAYRRTSAVTKIQESCQETLTQISNIVRNSTSLTVIKDDGKITFESKNYDNKKIIIVYVEDSENKNGKIYVDYDHAETISGKDWGEATVPQTDTSLLIGEQKFLLAENITNFEVNYSTYNKPIDSNNDGVYESEEVIEQNRTLDLVLSMEKNDKDYTHEYKASLRNTNGGGPDNELIIVIRDNTIASDTNSEPN
jgi:prepilin-type N-terminal cleavage/methylation domain-containing protein